jgi:hypothetical protein
MRFGASDRVLISRALPGPPLLILHCTLLINTVRQWKFALPGAYPPGKGPKMGRNAGSDRSETTSLLGA